MNQVNPVALRRFLLGTIITILLLAAWKLPLLKSVAGMAVLEPSAVWCVIQQGNSQISTGWESNLLSTGGEQTIMEFEGSDVVRLVINPGIGDGSVVAEGDTIATILSLATESAIGELEAQLEFARAKYAALQSGARSVDIDVAAREVEYSTVALEAFRPEYDRSKELYSRNFISLDKLQNDEGKLQTLIAAQKLAESNYNALLSGARPVDLEVASAEVTRLERMLEYAHKRHELRRAIVSPISGLVSLADEAGNLIRINRTDTLAIVISLPETMLSDIKSDAKIEMTLALDGSKVMGVFNRILYRQSPKRSGSFAVGFADNRSGELKPGMRGHGDVETLPRSLLSSVNRTLRAQIR